MKKHIAFMISCIMFAVCFYFPGYALEYYAYTDNVSFDYGDVSLYAQLSGVPSNMDGSNDENGWDIEYNFSVTLTNKTSDFQVADTNLFKFYFNSGYSDYFTKNQFTNTFELVDSSDNASNIKWTTNVSYLSFEFKDSDLLVLNPNESRSYNFVLKQHFPFNVNISWYGNTIVASSLTYNSASSITISTKPSAFTSKTVEDFIANDSFPNSVIAWLMANYELLKDVPEYHNYYANYNSGNSHTWYEIESLDSTQYEEYYRISTPGFRILSSDHNVTSTIDGVNYGEKSVIGVYDLYVYYRLRGKGTYDCQLIPQNHGVVYNPTFTTYDWTAIGTEWDVIDQYGLAVTQCNPYNNSTADFPLITYNPLNTSANSGVGRYASKDPIWYVVKLSYYFIIEDTSLADISNVPDINNMSTANWNGNTNGFRVESITTHTILWYLRNWWQEQHQDVNQDISDESGTLSDTQDTIHAQEQQWYSDNESAIEATGLSNFEFSSGELDGLTQLRLQFAQVWGALGDWTLVYIFVLSLSLATFILRHRPTTKAQQRMADSAQYRADVRNRWAVQDARASNNSNGFSAEIWRRAGYR